MKDIGRNDPCYCGSGDKYKKCHGSHRSALNIFEAKAGYYQNLFRRAYLALARETSEKQKNVVEKIKETAILLMCHKNFSQACKQNGQRIKQNIADLETFAREKGVYKDPNAVIPFFDRDDWVGSMLQRAIATTSGRDTLNMEEDLMRTDQSSVVDYRQRTHFFVPKNYTMLIGVLASGLYYAAVFHSVISGLNPELRVLKKSRFEKKINIVPDEENAIRSAIDQKREIIVVDDKVHSFDTFFAIYNYFGKPSNMSFSAVFYNSPLPLELRILERELLQRMAQDPQFLCAADKQLKDSFATIMQYGSIDRAEIKVKVRPPLFYRAS